MSNFQESIVAIESMREMIGDKAANAAIRALETEQRKAGKARRDAEKAKLEAIKAKQAAKYDPLRIALGNTFAKMFNVSEHPDLRIVLDNFNENGENASPTMVLSTAVTDGDGKTKTKYLFGGITRKPRNGKTYRGAVVTLKDVVLGDGSIKVAEGTEFDNTQGLAKAIGYGKGKFGYYNELRAHGYGRGKTWEYVAAIAEQAKETGAGQPQFQHNQHTIQYKRGSSQQKLRV